MKIRPMGAELFHADRRTDSYTDRHDEANSRFSQFYERAYKLQTRIYIKFFFLSSTDVTHIYTILC